jgi:hypothetical protein
MPGRLAASERSWGIEELGESGEWGVERGEWGVER